MQLFKRTKQEKPVKQISVSRSKWRYLAWAVVIAVVGVAGWVAVSGYITLQSITSTDASDTPAFIKLGGTITPADVTGEGSTRVNILLAGIGGAGHDGPDLTDTLQVLSVDPVNKTAAMLSIPRDLYITQVTGERSKINAVNADGAGYCKIKGCASGVDPGGAAMKDMVQKVLGVHIDYFARINFNGFKQLVDAVGGVDVNVTSALSDPFYPCPDPSTSYCPLYVSAGAHHFDGAAALKYARSRETTSDFDRSKRQQQVLEAVKQKATSTGMLANPQKVTQLLGILGANFKTDLPSGDMLKVLNLFQGISTSQITVSTLDTTAGGPLKAVTDPQAGYIILPVLGMNNYADVQLFAAKALPDPYITKEHASVAVINATGKPSQDPTIKKMLAAYGYNVISFTDAAKAQNGSTVTNSSSSPFTVSLLKLRFKASAVNSSSPNADITLTIGSNYLK